MMNLVEKESCVNCVHCRECDGVLVCKDDDGLYFNWHVTATMHCPDYEKLEMDVKECKKAV